MTLFEAEGRLTGRDQEKILPTPKTSEGCALFRAWQQKENRAPGSLLGRAGKTSPAERAKTPTRGGGLEGEAGEAPIDHKLCTIKTKALYGQKTTNVGNNQREKRRPHSTSCEVVGLRPAP